MPDKIDFLVKILLSDTAREDERDDAAMDLGRFSDERALIALIQVASNPNEDEMILASCGESIGAILIKKRKYDVALLDDLAPIAKHAAYSFIKASQND
ncbi:MAG: hypothetical protein Q8L98_04990 [Chlamydiales bacterium]|nr:hypothetical protein [Chlamydiales bacterium]